MRSPLKPSSTTKWLKFQWMMQGIGVEQRRELLPKSLRRQPEALAALTTLLALLPSRETPHATRSCSSGTHAP